MKRRPAVAPIEPLPYSFRRADGTVLIVCAAEPHEIRAVEEAEQRRLAWHGETWQEVVCGEMRHG